MRRSNVLGSVVLAIPLLYSCRASPRRPEGEPERRRTVGVQAAVPGALDSVPPVTAAPLSTEQRRGQALYGDYCWTCHGLYGHGDGPGARGFPQPLPDLERVAASEAVDRIVARLLSEQPTPGAPSPRGLWHTLDSAGLHAAAAYIKSFSPTGSLGNLAAGRLLYANYCVSCHGTRGAGNGRLAHLLSRAPADLRAADVVEHPSRLLEAIRSGDTSGHGRYMPNWGRAFSDQELWDLVAYVRVLRVPP